MTCVSLWITLWKWGISQFFKKSRGKNKNVFQIKSAGSRIQKWENTSSVNKKGLKIDQMSISLKNRELCTATEKKVVFSSGL